MHLVRHLSSSLALLAGCGALSAFDLVEARPLTERIIVVHVDEGHVQFHQKGQKRTDDRMVMTPFDAAAVARPEAWTITGAAGPVRIAKLGRKAKGNDFAWMVQGWDNQRNLAVNHDPDHAKEHWLYLVLDAPLSPGGSYTIASTENILPALTCVYDPTAASDAGRSDAVHVSLVGTTPDAPAKFAYVSAWMGDLGGLDLGFLDGRRFRLIDQQTGSVAFSGPLIRRAAADQVETLQASDTPKGNFQSAEVWQGDFSAFDQPGTYRVVVDGVGASYPLRIAADAFREVHHATARALYHNRSGIELKQPFTEFVRPAPHHPTLTPGFAGKLVYTRSRFADWKNQDCDPGDKPAIEQGIVGPLDEAWGFYQDAGDWDGYFSHLNVATVLLIAYETAPANFPDGDLNLPESGNGVPDLLDEAAWLPRWCHRVRHALLRKGWGTGGLGLRVCGDHFGGDGDGVPSYEDVHRTWIVSGEDPWSTFRYAGVAAHLAHALHLAKAKDPAGVDWIGEARETYAWALAHTTPADEQRWSVRDFRAYAAAALYRVTGDAAYEAQLAKDYATTDDAAGWSSDRALGGWIHALGGGSAPADQALAKRLRDAVLTNAELKAITNSGRRAMRWAGDFGMPMLIGQQTTPWVIEGMIGHHLTRDTDPALATRFKAAVHTTADYFLGGNALNLTWVTGIGPNPVRSMFHLDAWYNGTGRIQPGLTPYGPWRKEKDLGAGPWDQAWPHASLYPGIDAWPGAERWFENRCAPMNAEFTIHQNTCYTAATYGWLCAPKRP